MQIPEGCRADRCQGYQAASDQVSVSHQSPGHIGYRSQPLLPSDKPDHAHEASGKHHDDACVSVSIVDYVCNCDGKECQAKSDHDQNDTRDVKLDEEAPESLKPVTICSCCSTTFSHVRQPKSPTSPEDSNGDGETGGKYDECRGSKSPSPVESVIQDFCNLWGCETAVDDRCHIYPIGQGCCNVSSVVFHEDI